MLARKRHCFSDDYEAVAHLITIEIAHGHLDSGRLPRNIRTWVVAREFS